MTRGQGKVKSAMRTTETVIRGTSGFVGFMWRHRVGLGPILAGLAVLLIALFMGWFIKSDVFAYGSILVGAALMTIWIHFGVSDREGKTHARREQVHFYTITVAAAACLVLYYRYVLPGTVALIDALVIFGWVVGILGAPWWWNLRRRTRVTLENDLDAWPLVTEGTHLAQTWWSGYKVTANGWTAFLHIPGKMSRRTALESGELIEGLTKSPSESVTIEPAGKNPNLVRVTCIKVDPHATSIEWDGQVLRSVKELALLGRYSDQSLEKTRWFEDGVGGFHRLFGGTTRSGKSGLMHLLCALYGPADDVVLWGIDLKGGTALLPWAPMFDWVATTVEEAMFMMMCAEELVNARAKTLGRRGLEVAPISDKMPAVLLFCDEISSLIGDSAPRHVSKRAAPAMVEVAKKGAGMGVFLTLATQYPTLAALNSSQLKSQLGWRACFRLLEPAQGHYILPNMHKGVDPYNIPVDRRGTCYIDAQGTFRYATLRVVYFNHEKHRRPLVMKYWETTPSIDSMSLKWTDPELIEVYKKRTIWTPNMLDQVASDEVSGHGVEDLWDDSDDADGDGDVDERDKSIEDGDFDEHGIPVDPADEPIVAAVTAYAEDDEVRAKREAKQRKLWLESRQMKPESNARAAMYDALNAAPPEGIGPRELAKLCGRTERTIHNWLKEDEVSGKVERRAYGRYVAAMSVK